MEKWGGSAAPKKTSCHLWEPIAGVFNLHKQRAPQNRGFAGCMQKVIYR